MTENDYIIVATPAVLGKIVRSARTASGCSLRSTSEATKLGVRFLSEFERGKPTAEIGKVMQALHAAGLKLAVIPHRSELTNSIRLSQKLELEFPYDWSNPDIDESTFIRLVLEKTRFNDILRIAHHFGLNRVQAEAEHYANSDQARMINKYLSRIQTGFELARSQITSPS